jgi:hypothetical protein
MTIIEAASSSEFTNNTTCYLHKMLCLVHLLGMTITLLWSGIKWLQNCHICKYLDFHVVNSRVKAPDSEKTDKVTFNHINRLCLAQLLGFALTLLLSGIKQLDNRHFCHSGIVITKP